MRRAFLLVDLGFGDNSKGATTDKLCREFECDLVVRYSGGPQAGHNVQLPDGTRHTFSQFGSGTFAGASTYLGPSMIINPKGIVTENNALKKLGYDPIHHLRIHPDCLVSTIYHQAMNRIRETSRGIEKHGSCGLGVGETREYWLTHGDDALFASDIKDIRVIRRKLDMMRYRFLDEIRASDSLFVHDEHNFMKWDIRSVCESIEINSSQLHITDVKQKHDSVVYEASQGILLDQTYGFHPHCTWSDVTLRPALEMINCDNYSSVTTLGLTRAFTCRHGEGPLPGYSSDLTIQFPDPGNPRNHWQGSMRVGWLDLSLLDYAIANCGDSLDGLVVSHLDQFDKCEDPCVVSNYASDATPWNDALENKTPTINRQQYLNSLLKEAMPNIDPCDSGSLLSKLENRVPIFMTAYGPTHENRNIEV